MPHRSTYIAKAISAITAMQVSVKAPLTSRRVIESDGFCRASGEPAVQTCLSDISHASAYRAMRLGRGRHGRGWASSADVLLRLALRAPADLGQPGQEPHHVAAVRSPHPDVFVMLHDLTPHLAVALRRLAACMRQVWQAWSPGASSSFAKQSLSVTVRLHSAWLIHCGLALCQTTAGFLRKNSSV